MSVSVTKSGFNVREKLKQLQKPIGLKGSELMRAETTQDARDLVSAGRKNLIINGDMRIDQRNNGATLTTPNVDLAVDRWKCATYVTGTTIQRSTTAPPGFTHSYLMTNGTAVAPYASTYYQQIWHTIEGSNTSQLAWGTSNAKPISISFWVRSSVPGLYSFGLGNGTSPDSTNNTRSFCQTFTIDSTNTWEYKTFNIPGCPSGTWNTDSSYGITIAFNLGSGTAYDTNSPGLWSSSSTYMHTSTSSTIEFNNITGATFYLTGVQLEVGKNATEFEHRSFGEEFALCQRYFQKIGNINFHTWSHDIADTSGMRLSPWSWPGGPMRVSPTLSFDDGNGNSNRFNVRDSDEANGSTNVAYSISKNEYGILTGFKYPYAVSGFTKGQSGYAAVSNLTLSAEL